jgi:hypothetical protein
MATHLMGFEAVTRAKAAAPQSKAAINRCNP